MAEVNKEDLILDLNRICDRHNIGADDIPEVFMNYALWKGLYKLRLVVDSAETTVKDGGVPGADFNQR